MPTDFPSATEAEEFRRDIYAFADRIQAKSLKYLDLAEQAKAAKKSWESEIQAEQDYVTERRERYPLFDRDAPEVATEAEAPAEDAWRETPLEVLGCPVAVHAKLIDAGLLTLGSLADWTARDNLLTDVLGIGAAKARQVEQALERFWAERAPDADGATREFVEADNSA